MGSYQAGCLVDTEVELYCVVVLGDGKGADGALHHMWGPIVARTLAWPQYLGFIPSDLTGLI